MAHDLHFLRRLGRANLPQAELAMVLYHDAQLVRELLALAQVTEQVEQVAVCLAEGTRGPYLVVHRNGRFVTCLAEGMVPTAATPVISHATLQRAAARVERLRTLLALGRELDEEKLQVRRLIRRLHHAANEVSREEILALLPFQPLLAIHFFQEALERGTRLLDLQPEAMRVARRQLRSRRDLDVISAFFDALWCHAHLLVLAFGDSLAWVPRVLAILPDPQQYLSWISVGSGYMPILLRGLWAIGRLGKVILPQYKRGFPTVATERELVNAGFGLAVIGMRHTKLLAEVRKCIPRPHLPDEEDNPYIHNYIEMVNHALGMAFTAFDDGEEICRQRIRNHGARLLVDYCREVPSDDGAHHYTSPAEVPDDLALAQAVGYPSDIFADPQLMVTLACLLPWVARCRLEELYLPQSFITSHHDSWNPVLAQNLLRTMQDYMPTIALPAQRPATPGRNDPCPCGSGKKYKRCCGR